jgi:mono/diheme cytochrome c family protein
MQVLKTFAVLIVIALVATMGFVATAWRPPIAPVVVSDAHSFDPVLVKRGAELAAIGNCNVCHTAPGGRAYSGGLGVPTPFGTIYSTNITPDADTGIGRWSEAAFRRAMREGVDRQGRHLYPAFPYDHFTLVTDEDDSALYAYFMTRDPVPATAPANELAFPLNIRLLIAGWKFLYFRPGPYQPVPSQSAALNHGAYLVEGLAHCGACHTPRNALGAEKKRNRFAGGEAEGWTAYALDQSSPAPVLWDAAALRSYLASGWHAAHGVARGPMAAVVDNLASAPRSDLEAISAYMSAIIGEPSEDRRRAGEALLERIRQHGPASTPAAAESQTVGQGGGTAEFGALIYQAACASCHESGRPLPFGGVDLALSTGPSGPNARNMINVVLWGLPPANGERSPIMPGFAGALTDRQLADLLVFLRSRFSDKSPWTYIEKDIGDARTGRRPVMVHSAPAIRPDRTTVSQSETLR